PLSGVLDSFVGAWVAEMTSGTGDLGIGNRLAAWTPFPIPYSPVPASYAITPGPSTDRTSASAIRRGSSVTTTRRTPHRQRTMQTAGPAEVPRAGSPARPRCPGV